MLGEFLQRIGERIAAELIDEVVELPIDAKQAVLLQNLQYRPWVLRAQVLARLRNSGHYGAFASFDDILDRVGIEPERLRKELRVLDAILDHDCKPSDFIDQSVDDLAAQLDRPRTPLLVEVT